MGCIIKYKGQSISEEQFLQYLNKQIAINNLFNENESLANEVYEALGFDNKSFTQFIKGNLDGSKLSQEIEGKLEANKDRLIELLGSSMYSEKLKDVVYKELLQNSFDAIKIAESKGLIDKGKIDIVVNEKERIISFEDNGIGMTSDIVQKAFFTIGGTYKGDDVDNKLKSGGLGLAKMAFIFGSEELQLETIHNGIKTTVYATSEDIRKDNFKIKTESTTQKNGTKVAVKIPKTYIDSKGENRDIDFPKYLESEFEYSFLKNPLIGNVDVYYSFVNRESSYYKDEKIKTNLGNIPEGFILFTPAKTSFADMDIYIDTKNVTRGSYLDTKHKILSSGLYQFNVDFKTDDNETIPLNIIIDIKPKVDATNAQYPFNNQRENFKPTVKNDIGALNKYLTLLWHSIEIELLKNSFNKIKSIDTIDVENVDNSIIEKNKEITKEFTSLSNSNIIKSAIEDFTKINEEVSIESGGLKTKNLSMSKEDIDKDKEKAYNRTFKAEKEISINKENSLKLDSNKPIIHNNTNMLLDEKATRFLSEISSIMIEYKKSIINFYGENYSDNIKDQLWGVSIDKNYGGINVNPSFVNMLAINPFYQFPNNPKVDAVTYLAVALDHLIIHELNHNFERNEGAGFTGRFLTTYSEVHSLPNYFELISKLKLSIKNNLETIKKLNYEYEKSENVESGFEGNKLEENNKRRTDIRTNSISQNDSTNNDRTTNDDKGSSEKFGEIINNNQPTPQQKQRALQLYSQYLDTGKQDIQGFKEFIEGDVESTEVNQNNLYFEAGSKIPMTLYRGYALPEDREAYNIEETVGKTAVDYDETLKGAFYFTSSPEEAKDYAEGRTDSSDEVFMRDGKKVTQRNRHYTGDYAKVSKYHISADAYVEHYLDITDYRKTGKDSTADVIVLNQGTLYGGNTEYIVRNPSVIVYDTKDKSTVVQKSQERLNQVQKLFESNPKLANEVYEALGFSKLLSLEDILKEYTIEELKQGVTLRSLQNKIEEKDFETIKRAYNYLKSEEKYRHIKKSNEQIESKLKELREELRQTKETKVGSVLTITNDENASDYKVKVIEINKYSDYAILKVKTAKNKEYTIRVESDGSTKTGFIEDFVFKATNTVDAETIKLEIDNLKSQLQELKSDYSDYYIDYFDQTPQQKQEAQTKFQEYVDATGRQDIEGFKEFVSNKSIESKEGNTNSNYKWARYSNNSYEVSSQGDKRFSALFAKLQPGANITITRGFPDGTYSLENVKLKAPLTIEEIYQIYIKGYKTVQEGKGKPPKYDISKEESYNLYKNLWKVYLEQNPELEQDLREKAKGKVLTDKFASTDVSQARALAEILNEKSPTVSTRTLQKRNVFTVRPIRPVDKKATIKASVSNKFIGYGEGVEGSSTENYRKQAGEYANTGNYNSNDVVFVSIGGKRGNEQIRKEQQDRTIKEALKAIEAGATLITDNKSYVESSTYNEGEKRLAKNLEYKGYNYSEQTVDGQVLGIWKKEQERANVSDDTIDKPITEQENTKALLSEAISERKDSICDSQLCRTLIDTLSKNIFVNGEKIERIITPQTPITPMSRVLPILESMLRQANATFTNSLEVLKSSISSMYMGRALSNEEALTNDPTFFELANFFYINDVGPDTEVDETISIKNIARNNIEKIQDKETEEAVYGLNNISDKEELLNRLPSLITGSLEIGDLITNKQALELCPELKNLTIEINPNITESIIIKKTKIGSIPILSLRRLSDSTGTIDENVGQKVENAIALFVQAKCGFLNGVTSLNYKNNFTQLKDLNSLILSKLNLLESITEEQRETEKFKAIQYEINMLNDTMYQLLMGLYKINDENPFNSKETVEILPISRKLSEAAMKSSAYSGARLNHDGSVNLNSEQARTVMQSLGIYPVTEKNKLCRIP